MALRAVLPQNELSSDSRDVVKLGIGLVVTLAALVLGLLIASAKTSFDTQNVELTEMSSRVILLDRVLAHYGPEADGARGELRSSVVHTLDTLLSKDASQLIYERRTSLRQNPRTLTKGRCATLDQGPSTEHSISLGTNALADGRTKSQFSFRTVADRTDFLAYHYFHQLRPLRTSQRNCGRQLIGFRDLGFRCNLPDSGAVLTLCGTDSRLQRPAPRCTYASRPIVPVWIGSSDLWRR
jgi:hypothetical protein